MFTRGALTMEALTNSFMRNERVPSGLCTAHKNNEEMHSVGTNGEHGVNLAVRRQSVLRRVQSITAR